MEASTLTFTLIIWLMMGWRFEETQSTEPMGAEQCLEQLFRITTDRYPAFQANRSAAKGECVGSDGKLRLPRVASCRLATSARCRDESGSIRYGKSTHLA
jgi:hypothetical protein